MRKNRTETDINLFRAIEVFMAVAEMRQVTGAALALGITQSAASQHLKNLELAFGVSLLNRAQRPVALTHAGEVLQRHGFRILNQIDDLKSDLRHLNASVAHGASGFDCDNLDTGLYDYVENQLKVPELVLSAGLATDHQTALNARQIDLAITS